MRTPTRRTFLGSAAALAAAAGAAPIEVEVAAQQARGGRAAPPPDVRLINGRIHTMDAKDTVARAVAITDGRITAVGDRIPAAAPHTQTIDLRGRTVVPGLIEPHVHIVSLANRPGYH